MFPCGGCTFLVLHCSLTCGEPHPGLLKQTLRISWKYEFTPRERPGAVEPDFGSSECTSKFVFDCTGRSTLDTNHIQIWAKINVIWPVSKVTANYIWSVLAKSTSITLWHSQQYNYRRGVKRWFLTESLSTSPLSTRSRYSCLSSLSSRDGRPGYMVDPPDNTMCL